MLSSSMAWIGTSEGENQTTASTWAQNTTTNNNNGGGGFDHNKQETEMGPLYTFNSMLQQTHQDITTTTSAATAAAMHEISFSPSFNVESAADNDHLLFHPVDYSSATCSPTSASVFNNNNHPQVINLNYFLPPKPQTTQTAPNKNPFDGAFESGCENGYLESALIKGVGFRNFGSESPQTGSIDLSPNDGFLGNNSNYDSLFLNNNNRIKFVNPLDNLGSSIGAQPTLFQKRAALRKNSLGNSNLGCLNLGGGSNKSPTIISGENEKKRKLGVIGGCGDDLEDVSINDRSNDVYYDSDDDDQVLENSNNGGVSNYEMEEISGKNGGSSSNGNSTVAGGGGPDRKGKKKGPPAKNLMAERRRRKKLNDRLLMLRSVVPNISKMDRTSILGDAIDYLKELLQKINDLNNELESTPPTPTAPGFPPRFKEERSQIAFASPRSSPTGQPSRVEVRLREGRGLSIHMFCGCKPGLLLSTMRAMDNLGLDVQQAVISCFNGFALDVFRAEQCLEGQDLHPDQIKAMLLDSTSFHHGMV